MVGGKLGDVGRRADEDHVRPDGLQVSPLASGTYYSRCDLHPLMNGTFLAL